MHRIRGAGGWVIIKCRAGLRLRKEPRSFPGTPSPSLASGSSSAIPSPLPSWGSAFPEVRSLGTVPSRFIGGLRDAQCDHLSQVTGDRAFPRSRWNSPAPIQIFSRIATIGFASIVLAVRSDGIEPVARIHDSIDERLAGNRVDARCSEMPGPSGRRHCGSMRRAGGGSTGSPTRFPGDPRQARVPPGSEAHWPAQAGMGETQSKPVRSPLQRQRGAARGTPCATGSSPPAIGR